MGETVLVNILKTYLMNIYMTIFRHQLTEEDFVEEEDNGQTYSQTTAAAGECKIPAQWYLVICESNGKKTSRELFKDIHSYQNDKMCKEMIYWVIFAQMFC